MRITVVFNGTPVLVPCGDGKMTVGELIEKAIVRFKKVAQNKAHPGDVLSVRGLRMADGGSLIDQDDEVAEVLEDKEAVLLDFDFTPHYEVGDSFTTAQPYDFLASTSSSAGIDTSQEDHAVTPPPHCDPAHIGTSEASQDTELVASWHDSQSSGEPSPPLDRKATPPRWSGGVVGSAGMIMESQDSGYAPNKSQESYGHSQPKSQEGYPSASSEMVFQSTSQSRSDFSASSTKTDFPSGSSTKPDFTKTDFAAASKVRSDEETKPPFIRGADSSRFSQKGREKPDNFALTPPRSRDSYSFSSQQQQQQQAPREALHRAYPYSDGRGLSSSLPHPQAFEESFERGRYQPVGGWHYHDLPPYHPLQREEPPHYWGSGRFSREGAGHFPPVTSRRSDRFGGMPRTLSHERMDQPYPLPGRPGRTSEEEQSLDYFLSQPSPSYFSYDRPPGYPPGPVMSYDQSRLAMSGPSGHSLSQPGMMLAHSRGGGGGPPFSDRLPGASLKMRGRTDSLERGRGFSLEDEFSRLDEEEEMFEEQKGRGKPSPFRRDFRKSMFRDGPLYAQWMERIEEYGIQDGDIGLPEFEGDTSQSQRTPSPKPAEEEEEHKKPPTDESEDDDEFGNIHIVELHKGEEALGLELVPCTSPHGQDLGVFIGSLSKDGFAAKSGKVQMCDRILACNGIDFTKESNARVEELFVKMCQEPLLRMAVSRGLQQTALPQSTPASFSEQPAVPEQMAAASPAPARKIASSMSSQAPSTTLTNTRQMGTKHALLLDKGPQGFGFGLSSRDVLTDDHSQPIYIKSITSGGAAFVDGRLRIGDRLLSVDGVEVTGMRQGEVAGLLRAASGQVRLVVSRHAPTSEEEEEEEVEALGAGRGGAAAAGKSMLLLDIPLYKSGAAGLGVTVYGKSQSGTGDMGIYIKSVFPGGAAAMDGGLRKNDQLLSVANKTLVGRSNQDALEVLRQALAAAGSGENARVRLVVARRSIGGGSPSMAALGEEPEEDEVDGGGGEGREVGIDVPLEQPPQAAQQQQQQPASLLRAEDALGSGEFDRLEPLVAPSSQEVMLSPHSSSQPSTQSSSLSEQLFSWYDAAAASVNTGSQPPGGDYSSLDRKGVSRPLSQTSDFAMPPLLTTPPTSRHGCPPAHRGRHSNRELSPYDHAGRYQSFSPFSDSASLASSSALLDSSQLPTRGSGRRDRNKPERGSGRAPHSSQHGTATSPDPVFSTLPRAGSRSSDRSPAGPEPETTSLCSLDHLRLTDSESNEAFRRDNPGRISITKKTKKNPLQDLAHFQYANQEPLMEGEAGPVLARTGSDGCLSEAHRRGDSELLLRGLELGPQLGMVKSSSLESLHNVMQHSIQRDMVDDGSELRNRHTRNSFRRAVDRSLEQQQQQQQQRGVDVPYELEGSATVPALVSYTKSPHGKKTNKTGFLKKVFKKRRRKVEAKDSPKLARKQRGSSVGASLEAAASYDSSGLLAQRYTLRQMSDSGSSPTFRPYSMSVLEGAGGGYESPSSPDDQLLSTLARV